MAPQSDPPAQPQRQSCNRCHKQKLRCTRENGGDNGTCDRCARKRIQCVYSSSLPKGRPSLQRQAEESAANSRSGSSRVSLEPETKAVPMSMPMDMAHSHSSSSTGQHDHGPHGNISVDNGGLGAHGLNSSEAGQSLMFELMDQDMITETWSWLHTFSMEEVKPVIETDWTAHDMGYFDPRHLNHMGDGSSAMMRRTSSPNGLPSPVSLPSSAYAHGGNHHHSLSSSAPSSKTRDRSDTLSSMHLDDMPSFRSVSVAPVIAELSQLSTRLSTLYDASSALANSAHASNPSSPAIRQALLVQSAAFQSVASWVAHGQDGSSSGMTTPSGHTRANSLDVLNFQTSDLKMPDAIPGQGILHEVFSASHSFLETLRYLQVHHGHLPLDSSAEIKPHCQIIVRHLVVACDILLLQIYVSVLVALQYDAQPSPQMSGTVLGDVRLVLVVQLCSHLIERQYQAVDSYLGSSSLMTPPLAESFPMELPHIDRQASTELKKQVQARLAYLRQALQSTI